MVAHIAEVNKNPSSIKQVPVITPVKVLKKIKEITMIFDLLNYWQVCPETWHIQIKVFNLAKENPAIVISVLVWVAPILVGEK